MGDDNVVPIGGKRRGKDRTPAEIEADRAKMAALTARRLELEAQRRANGEHPQPTRAGRQRRMRPITDAEIREAALESAADLFAVARRGAVEKLIVQMDHKDPAIAQRAAVKILEYTDGKPTQTIETKGDRVTEVVYLTRALVDTPDDMEFVPEPLEADVPA